jgi:hypothetical protein
LVIFKIKKLNREGAIRQAIMHEQGFGNGSVKDLLVAINDLKRCYQIF